MSVSHKLKINRQDASLDCVVLDVGFLNRNTFGDQSLRNEIIDLFLAQLDGAQRTLSAPVNPTAWQFLTHTLKGAAAAVGATGLSSLADNWGEMSAPVTAQQRLDLQNQFKTRVSEFKQAVRQL